MLSSWSRPSPTTPIVLGPSAYFLYTVFCFHAEGLFFYEAFYSPFWRTVFVKPFTHQDCLHRRQKVLVSTWLHKNSPSKSSYVEGPFFVKPFTHLSEGLFLWSCLLTKTVSWWGKTLIIWGLSGHYLTLVTASHCCFSLSFGLSPLRVLCYGVFLWACFVYVIMLFPMC